MKDQITTIMEALRLAGVEIEHFKRGRQDRDATLDAIEAILYDPKVMAAVSNIEPFVEYPESFTGQRRRTHFADEEVKGEQRKKSRGPLRKLTTESAASKSRWRGTAKSRKRSAGRPRSCRNYAFTRISRAPASRKQQARTLSEWLKERKRFGRKTGRSAQSRQPRNAERIRLYAPLNLIPGHRHGDGKTAPGPRRICADGGIARPLRR